MEPVRNGGMGRGAATLGMAILLALATLIIVHIGGGLTHPLDGSPSHLSAAASRAHRG